MTVIRDQNYGVAKKGMKLEKSRLMIWHRFTFLFSTERHNAIASNRYVPYTTLLTNETSSSRKAWTILELMSQYPTETEKSEKNSIRIRFDSTSFLKFTIRNRFDSIKPIFGSIRFDSIRFGSEGVHKTCYVFTRLSIFFDNVILSL